jgi:predicted AAA+ superfamily ATPase
MINRLVKRPTDSFFLFGPRGTGKSTLLRSWFPEALWFDLLDQGELYRLLRSPGAFAQAVEAQPRNRWIVVDEIQKAPALLDEVHRLIEKEGRRFALSGSSARKLRRGVANLLAGRAFVYHLFPFTQFELSKTPSRNASLEFGGLPKIALEPTSSVKTERLRAYVGTYLAEEIKAEAVSRNAERFSRFLRVAALANGQVTNLSNIARDSGISRSTVSTHFSILEDTLIGAFLPAWQPRLKVKETGHPKFYFFDTGVFRELTDRGGESTTLEERGVLLETAVFHELRSAQEYLRKGGVLSYWRTHEGVEVDFVWTKREKIVAIEVKSSDTWKPAFGKGLLSLKANSKTPVTCLGVYAGPHRLKLPFGMVYPFEEFSSLLQTGKII